jgi:hypothetical protein
VQDLNEVIEEDVASSQGALLPFHSYAEKSVPVKRKAEKEVFSLFYEQ